MTEVSKSKCGSLSNDKNSCHFHTQGTVQQFFFNNHDVDVNSSLRLCINHLGVFKRDRDALVRTFKARRIVFKTGLLF